MTGRVLRIHLVGFPLAEVPKMISETNRDLRERGATRRYKLASSPSTLKAAEGFARDKDADVVIFFDLNGDDRLTRAQAACAVVASLKVRTVQPKVMLHSSASEAEYIFSTSGITPRTFLGSVASVIILHDAERKAAA